MRWPRTDHAAGHHDEAEPRHGEAAQGIERDQGDRQEQQRRHFVDRGAEIPAPDDAGYPVRQPEPQEAFEPLHAGAVQHDPGAHLTHKF